MLCCVVLCLLLVVSDLRDLGCFVAADLCYFVLCVLCGVCYLRMSASRYDSPELPPPAAEMGREYGFHAMLTHVSSSCVCVVVLCCVLCVRGG